MPYIDEALRPALDTHIEALAAQIKSQSTNAWGFAGMLNYVYTRLALRTMPARRYWVLALICGVFITALLEFYRRFVAPYEDEQIKKNGDVDR